MYCLVEFQKEYVKEIVKQEGLGSYIGNVKIVGGCPVTLSSGETRGITIFAVTTTSFLRIYYDYILKRGTITKYQYTKLGKLLLRLGIWHVGIANNIESVNIFNLDGENNK